MRLVNFHTPTGGGGGARGGIEGARDINIFLAALADLVLSRAGSFSLSLGDLNPPVCQSVSGDPVSSPTNRDWFSHFFVLPGQYFNVYIHRRVSWSNTEDSSFTVLHLVSFYVCLRTCHF